MTSAPWKWIAAGGAARTSPEIARSSVVFPAPFEPISVTISPAWTSSRMPRSAWIAAVADVEALDAQQRLARSRRALPRPSPR